jgi:hypothetical protein
MSDLYLITHKVRGEPALDVAVKMEMADGPWWIIPTSGHRAYPCSFIPLSGLEHMGQKILDMPFPSINDFPDHYPATPTRSVSPPARAGESQQRTASAVEAVPTLEDI